MKHASWFSALKDEGLRFEGVNCFEVVVTKIKFSGRTVNLNLNGFIGLIRLWFVSLDYTAREPAYKAAQAVCEQAKAQTHLVVLRNSWRKEAGILLWGRKV